MKVVLDEKTNRNATTAITNIPNEGNHFSIYTSLTSLPCKGKQGKNVVRSL